MTCSASIIELVLGVADRRRRERIPEPAVAQAKAALRLRRSVIALFGRLHAEHSATNRWRGQQGRSAGAERGAADRDARSGIEAVRVEFREGDGVVECF